MTSEEIRKGDYVTFRAGPCRVDMVADSTIDDPETKLRQISQQECGKAQE
jgi:hypothetical protein